MRDEAGHQAMLRCGKAWKRVKSHQTKLWSDWTMEIGPALMKARAEAMHLAGTNQPMGRGYNTAMSDLLKEYEVDDMSETARAHILKIMANLAAVEEWRANQKDPGDLNHPSRVWQKYQRSAAQADERKQQEREQRKAERKLSANQELEAAQARIQELEAEIEHLKVYIQELEAAMAKMRDEQPTQPKQPKRRGRPPGTKNRPKQESSAAPKRRGRPPGSKNRTKAAMSIAT
jgi:hypothetical protein